MNTEDKNSKARVFSFSNRLCPKQPTGGPGGVNYRLVFANRNYGYIENMIHVFQDVIFEKDATLKLSLADAEGSELEVLKRYLLKLDYYYHFSENDIYFFHDVGSAFIFLSTFPFTKTVLVYHQQGSLYKEWEYFSGQKDESRKDTLDAILITTIKLIKYLAFPSKGAIESLIESEPTLKLIVENANTKILYNGYDKPNDIKLTSNEIKSVITVINDGSQEPVFITVAALNEAKGVERIPEFLSKVKAKHGPFKWIIVGGGVKAKELEDNIFRYGIEDNVMWLQQRVPHDDILALFQYTDYYILTHRFSIFDFSTIEAMSYGNIPILTPVGGNKEVIIRNNGIFLYDLSDSKDYDEFIGNQPIDELKRTNMEIANELFSEKAFLKGYADIVEELLQNE